MVGLRKQNTVSIFQRKRRPIALLLPPNVIFLIFIAEGDARGSDKHVVLCCNVRLDESLRLCHPFAYAKPAKPPHKLIWVKKDGVRFHW